MSIAREGYPLIFVPLLLGVLLLLLWPWAGAVVIGLGLFSAYFFRDPERVAPEDADLVVAPADGKVVQLMPAQEPVLGAGTTQLSIFMSIFDVHVNRAPIAGRVAAVEYHPGKFLAAFNDKASLLNEQTLVTLEDGPTRVMFKQIAGLIARRVVFRKRVDDRVGRGERVGLIRFGSRVDVLLPPGATALVKVGDRVQGGSSVIARLAEVGTP